MASDRFWSLKKEIDEQYRSLSVAFSELRDEDLTEQVYFQFSRQLNHIQNLFDDISDEVRELDLVQSNPELYQLLEAKQDLNVMYGKYNRLRSNVFNRFAKFRGKTDDPAVSAPPAAPEIPENSSEPNGEETISENEELVPEEEFEPIPDRKKQPKKPTPKSTSTDTPQYDHQDFRREEAARLGVNVQPDQNFSDADLYHARYRLEEEARLQQMQAENRIQAENEALRNARERQERSERFEHLDNQHLDLSNDGISRPADTSNTSSESVIPAQETFQQTQETPPARDSRQQAQMYPDYPSGREEEVYPGYRDTYHGTDVNPDPGYSVPRPEPFRPFYSQTPEEPSQQAPYEHRTEDRPSEPTVQPERFSAYHEDGGAAFEQPHRPPEYDPGMPQSSMPADIPYTPSRAAEIPIESASVPPESISSIREEPSSAHPQTQRYPDYPHGRGEAAHYEPEGFHPDKIAASEQGHFNSSSEDSKPVPSQGPDLSSYTAANRQAETRPPESSAPVERAPVSQDPVAPAFEPVHKAPGADPGNYVPYQFTPDGAAPVRSEPQTAEPAWKSNADLYSSLLSQQNVQNQEPVVVSSLFESQMRFNVERAHLDYLYAKGTAEASQKAREYMEERNALMEYCSAIKQGRFSVSDPVVEPEPARPAQTYAPQPTKPEPSSTSTTVYSFTPNGTISHGINNMQQTGSRSEYRNVQQRERPAYTPSHPLIVAPEYEEAITNQMRKASMSLHSAAQAGDLQPHCVNPQQIQTYNNAYLSFQQAKRDGSVIVSTTGTGVTQPDFSYWGQKPVVSSGHRPEVNASAGTTGYSPTANPNKAEKHTVSETSANVFDSRKHLSSSKQWKMASKYMGQIGGHMRTIGLMTSSAVFHKAYNMIQSGEDNPIRTMETGRYYAVTAAGVILAMQAGKPGHDLATRVASVTSREFRLYGTKSLLTNAQVSATVNNGIRLNREFGAQIKNVEQKLAPYQAKIDAFAKLNPNANRFDALDKYSKLKYDRLNATLEKLHIERAEAKKAYALHRKMQDFRHEARLEKELLKKLEVKGQLPKSYRGLEKSAQKVQEQFSESLTRKYGELNKFSNKSLHQRLATLNTKGAELKAKIRLLEAKGSALSPAERKLLLQLRQQSKDLGKEVGRFKGLLRGREDYGIISNKLNKMLHSASLNKGRMMAGFSLLQGFMMRPLQAGADSNTDGIAGMVNSVSSVVRISSNRYVRIIVKGAYKASMFVGKTFVKTAMNLTVPGSAEAASKAILIAKTGIRTQVGVASKTIKTAVNRGVKTAARAAGNSISNAVPTGIKSAVSKSVGTAKKGRMAVRNLFDKAKNRLARSAVGRAYSAVNRGLAAFRQGAQMALSALKGVAVKAGLIFAGLLLFICILSVSLSGLAGMTGGGTIVSSKTSAEGLLDLRPYANILQAKQDAFDKKLEGYKNDSSYDNVTIEYEADLEQNAREILSMMAVRMSQELDMEKNQHVEPYLKYMFDVSHLIHTTETEYKCSGCETYTEYCKGCVERLERCNSRELATCKNKTEKGKCGGHTYKYCPGHKKKRCPGHVDLTVNVTVLSFDEIYAADHYNFSGTAVNGASLGTFKITYYCCEKYPHICNAGPPYKTATGTTPTPKRTIAVDPNVIKLGTHVLIDGVEYIAEDTGGAINEKRIDICVKTHAEAISLGTTTAEVFLPTYIGEGIQVSGEWEGWNQDNIEWCETICSADWTELYEGVDHLSFVYGPGTDLSGVQFVSGNRTGCQAIVDLALSQEGQYGGKPYWRWAGFDSRVPWCCIFVSWVANEHGVLNESIPRYYDCRTGIDWFENHHQWARKGSITPVAGDIIFFDWEPDGCVDHTGMVIGSDGTYVYTVEGNSSGNKVTVKKYSLDSKKIVGYGIPNY